MPNKKIPVADIVKNDLPPVIIITPSEKKALKQLLFEQEEKAKLAAELMIADKELIYQKKEKGKRAAELIIANKELVFQNSEKEKKAAELVIANKELAFQNQEKESRAAELIIANKELLFQNKEKEKRAAELVIANKELKSQNIFKEGLQAELISANIELVYQNKEREKRAAELLVANEELIFQNREKEKRAAELLFANTELEAFNYVSSHDLQEPLRKIQTFVHLILESELANLSAKGLDYFRRITLSAARMQQLIEDLLLYSRTNVTERKAEPVDLNMIIEDVKNDLKEIIDQKRATVETVSVCLVNIIPFQFRQLMTNLVGNSLKFADPERKLHIQIKGKLIKSKTDKDVFSGKDYCHIEFKDNGIGFDPVYNERIFEVFQQLHGKNEYKGTGIGLAIVKKIVENHHGIIKATGVLGKGAKFDIYIPM